ncbi:hypothetical protein Tco_0275707 [Tanacetum coccineum]
MSSILRRHLKSWSWDQNVNVVDLDDQQVRHSSENDFDNQDDDINEDESESDDADGDVDDIVDEDHIVDEVEVNMSGFKFELNAEGEAEFIDLIKPHVTVTENGLEVLDIDSFERDLDDVLENARRKGLRKLSKNVVSSGIKNNFFVQYALLRDYVTELQRCNLDTKVKIDVYREEDHEKTTRMFKRIYVCLGALKKGFKAGGRELLDLDDNGIDVGTLEDRVHESYKLQTWMDVYSHKHRFIMDDPNVTLEEYIRLEEEKARRQGRTFDWQTTRYDKTEYYENKYDSFTNLETEYPAIVFDDISDVAFSREPTVSPLDNNEINFKILFDESDDEDYMIVFDENSFSCKIISVDNLKTDSEKGNDKINIPSSPSPEPTIGYFDDLDLFKGFENEFPAIVYNDLKSKSDPLNKPSISSWHIDKFKTSLSEYDENEQNILCLSDSFSNNPKTIKDNDDSIDMTRLSRSNIDTNRSNKLPKTNHDKTNEVFNGIFLTLDVNILSWNYFNNWMPLNLIKKLYVPFSIPFDPKQYYKDGAHTRILRRPSYEQRLETIWGRPVNQVQYGDVGDDGEALFTSHAWRRLFEVRGPLVREFIIEFLSTCRMSDTEMGHDVADTLCFQLGGARRRMTWRKFILALGLHSEKEMVEPGFKAYWSGRERVIPDKGDFRDYWIKISSNRDFLGPAPSYVHIRDPARRLYHRMIAWYFWSRRRGGEGEEEWSSVSGGHFIRRLAAHFGLVSDQGLRGLSVVVSELPHAAMVGAPGAAEGAPAVDEGAQAIPAPVQAPQLPPPAPQPQTMSQRFDRLEEELMDASGRTYQAFDNTLVGNLRLSYKRRVGLRTGNASTSVAPHTDDQPDP